MPAAQLRDGGAKIGHLSDALRHLKLRRAAGRFRVDTKRGKPSDSHSICIDDHLDNPLEKGEDAPCLHNEGADHPRFHIIKMTMSHERV